MREIEAIISSYDEAREKGQQAVLATVVHVEGSSYRAAGARMLVDELGFLTGAISGGCLEGDALKKALLALDQRKPKLITYDTSDEDDAVVGAQLGCNGIIQVLFEPIDPGEPDNPVELLRKAVDSGRPAAVVSFFNHQKKAGAQTGTALLVDEGLNVTGQIEDGILFKMVRSEAEEALAGRTGHFGEYRTPAGIRFAFIDVITPPPRLVLVGAGNDSRVLSDMASLLGWEVIVADGRASHANKTRFSSCQVIVTNPGEILENITVDETTAFVLMTHNYNYDLDVLKLLLNEELIPYIGILGPGKKYQRMLDDLEAAGITLPEKQAAKIYAPVGLQLGAESPAEIGLSILSEIQAVLADSDVRHLRELQGPIHEKKQYEFKVIEL